MSDRDAFIAILVGIASAIVGGLVLFAPLGLFLHYDAGDDGFAFLWIALSILSGIVGFCQASRWIRKRNDSRAASSQ